jgi:UPF0755 protein
MRYIRAVMLGITVLALVAACAGYAALNTLRTPAEREGEPVEFVIEPGASTNEIATRLRSDGLIRQPAAFVLLTRMQGLDDSLQAGRYVLSPTMTMSEILIALQSGNQIEDVQVTIPEGLRIEEMAAIFEQAGLVDSESFLQTARDGAAFRNDYFLLNSLPPDANLEGYLFPDTYRFAPDAASETIVRTMLERFIEQYGTIERDIRVPGASVHDIVTMASIVQREAALTSEMPLISAVFWNRLQPENAPTFGGGLLGADPTIQYALGYSAAEQTWWRKNLTVSELAVDSRYNTRLNPGLPPGPIAAPGLDALRAAAQPAEDQPYLFFVASCAKDGSHQFAATFEEFQAYEAEWLACQ